MQYLINLHAANHSTSCSEGEERKSLFETAARVKGNMSGTSYI